MTNLKEQYVKFADSVNLIVRYACIVFFSIMVIDVVASVVMRYVLVKPMVWGEQLAVYCMIWIAFLSSSIAFRRGAHMGLDLLVKSLDPKLSSIIQSIAHVMVLGFLLVLTVWELNTPSLYLSRFHRWYSICRCPGSTVHFLSGGYV